MPVYRPLITGTRHIVSAGHHAAAHAGFTVLESGGNAIDAGVAAGVACEVLQTDRVNFAGVAPIMIYLADRQEIVNIDGLGTWPRAVTPDYFMKHHSGKMPPGLLRTVVPAAPDAWITALEKYGTMSFGEVASAAIRFARDGFAMHWFMADYIRDHEQEYRRWPSTAEVFLPNGRPPAVGDLFVQRDLGRTIQYMADEEAAHAKRGRAAGLQAAVEAPRFATYSFPGSSAPHAYHPGRLNLEARIPKNASEALARLGHKIAWWLELECRAGAVCAIRVDPQTGILQGAADPRRPAYAVGW